MRAAVLVALVLALIALAWALSEPGVPARPPAPVTPTARSGEPPPPGTRAAERVSMWQATAPARAAGNKSAVPDDLAPGTGRLLIAVADRTTGDALRSFRFVLVDATGGRRADIVGGSEASVDIPLDVEATITIESDGYEPSGPFAVRLTAAEPVRPTPVWLLRSARGAGLELRVQNPALLPVTSVEVRAFSVDPRTSDERLLWQRLATDPRGVYRLPELGPGRYRMRLRAAGAAGLPSQFLPHDEVLEFNGTELIQRHIVLQPGCLLHVGVRDTYGRVLGTEVSLRVVWPDGSTPALTWTALVDGKRIERVDGPPGPVLAQLTDPLPAGRYRVQARVGTGLIAERVVQLAAGQSVGITLTVER